MKTAREAGATEPELAETIRIAQRVRMVSLGNHEKFSNAAMEILKELAMGQNTKGGTDQS